MTVKRGLVSYDSQGNAMIARALLEWNEQVPESITVIDSAPEGQATRTFSVYAHYGWADRILCVGCYQQDAEAIAAAIREACGIPEPAADSP